MKHIFFMVAFVFAMANTAHAGKMGKITGGMAHEYPEWFKDSFLDLKEDASEAAAENKHTILFMSLNGCPYCAKMLNEGFAQYKDFIIENFDTIGINIKGDRMVMMDGENEISEKTMAGKLGVRFTPTVLFLDQNADIIFRINGYWYPEQFRQALDFVRTKSYKKMSIIDYIKQQRQEGVWNFAKHEQFKDIKDFSTIKRPLLLLFEDTGCSGCKDLHSNLLSLPDVKEVLKTFDFVRLDARSKEPVTDVNGRKTSPDGWAKSLNINVSPTFIAFDEGREIQRFDAKLFSHHFISILEYVSGKHYKTYDSWLKYNSKRTREVLESGRDVNMSDSDRNMTQ